MTDEELRNFEAEVLDAHRPIRREVESLIAEVRRRRESEAASYLPDGSRILGEHLIKARCRCGAVLTVYHVQDIEGEGRGDFPAIQHEAFCEPCQRCIDAALEDAIAL